MGLLSFLGFGKGKLVSALKQGATIIDVRTVHEYDQGHVRGAVNIPLDRIPANAERIRQMKKPVIFCCVSGSRSAAAVRAMKSKGIKDVYNGGSWETIIRLQQSL